MKVILFDLDGTLIDSTEAILESFKVALSDNMKFYDEKKILSLIGLPLDIMFKELGVDNEWEYVNRYKMHYRKISTQKTKLLPSSKEALKLASSFARLGVCTTKTSRYSKELLEKFGILDYFEVLIGREDVENPKPHPEPILKALSLMKADSNISFMVGDTCLDMISAKEAGIRGVGVEFNYDNKLRECSNIVKKDVLEAVEFIKNI